MHTRRESPTGMRLVALPILDSRRNSDWKAADTPTRISTRRSSGLLAHGLTQRLTQSPIRILTQNLIRGLDYVLAIGIALLCSYWILQGRW